MGQSGGFGRASDRRYTQALVLAPIAIIPVVSLLTPEAAFSRQSVLGLIADGIALGIPSINHLAKVSRFPELTKGIWGLAWLFVPLQVFVAVRSPVFLHYTDAEVRRRIWISPVAAVILLSAIVYVTVRFWPITNTDLDGYRLHRQALGWSSESRLGLGVLAGFVCTGVAIFVAAFLKWLRVYIRVLGRG